MHPGKVTNVCIKYSLGNVVTRVSNRSDLENVHQFVQPVSGVFDDKDYNCYCTWKDLAHNYSAM